MLNIITEILGQIVRGSPQNQSDQQITYSTPQTDLRRFHQLPGLPVQSLSLSLYGWQQQLYKQLIHNDAFIVTQSPGGGKSLPIIVYWLDHLLKLNTQLLENPINKKPDNFIQFAINNIIEKPEELPKILWITPFRSLNQDIISTFEVLITRLIFIIINELMSKHNTNVEFINIPREVISLAESMLSKNHSLISNLITLYVTYLDRQKSLSNLDVSNPDRGIILQTINSNAEQMLEIIGKIIKTFIDERFIGNEFRDEHTGLSINNRPKPVVVCIYELADYFIKHYKDNNELALVVLDEIQKIYSSEESDPSEKERAKKIGIIVGKVLSSKAVKNARIALLSGTQNPRTVLNLVNVLNEKFGRNFPIDTRVIPTANQANIVVRELDGLRDEDYIVRRIKELIHAKSKGNAFLFFSKQKIRKIASRVIGETSSNILEKQKLVPKTVQQPYYQSKDIPVVLGKLDASRIVDPLLRKAVERGFGFAFSLRPEDVEFYYPEAHIDNEIVYQLFKDGRIYVILVTDNIEAGVNINIRNLYIPKFEKIKGQSLTLTSKSQLLNRVGRAPMDCVIYAPSEYVDDIRNVLNITPNNFPEVDFSTKHTVTGKRIIKQK